MQDKHSNASIEGTAAELPMPFLVSARRLGTSWEMYSLQLGAHHVLHNLQRGLRKHGEWWLPYFVQRQNIKYWQQCIC